MIYLFIFDYEFEYNIDFYQEYNPWCQVDNAGC